MRTRMRNDGGEGDCVVDYDLPGEVEQARVLENLVMCSLREEVSRHCPGSCAGVCVEIQVDRHLERDRDGRWSYGWPKASLSLLGHAYIEEA
jgi:hypothetical protein